MNNPESKIEYSEDTESRFVDKRMENVKSDLIEITHDKIENILLKHLSKVEGRNSWITPFSILLTVLITRSTCEFKDAFNISKEVWDAFFILVCLGSIFWLIYSLIKMYRNWGQTSIEHLITLIKEEKKSK